MKRVLFISIIILAAVLLFVLNKKNTEQFNCYNCGRNDWTVGPRCLSCYNCGWCEKEMVQEVVKYQIQLVQVHCLPKIAINGIKVVEELYTTLITGITH